MRAGALLSSAAGKLYKRHGFANAEVLTEWPRVVGERLAEATVPEKLTRDGTLTIKVTPAFALELQHLEPQVLDRIATYFGHQAVKRLRLVQGHVPPPTPRPRPRRPRDLEAAEVQALEGRLASVEDDDMKQALDRLGRAILGSQTHPQGKT